jgi:hypothetical protein
MMEFAVSQSRREQRTQDLWNVRLSKILDLSQHEIAAGLR